MMEPSLQLSAPDKEASSLGHKLRLERVKVNFVLRLNAGLSPARLGVLCC